MRGRAAVAVLASLLAAGCAHGGRRGGRAGDGPDPGLRLWAPPIVRWGPASGRDVEFAVENETARTLSVAAADPAYAKVELFAGPGSQRVCGVEAAPARAAAEGTVDLEPGDRLAVRVDLEAACGGVPPGDYRYELSYRLPEGAGGAGGAGASAVAGALPTAYGQVVVAAGEREPPRRLRARSGRPDRR